MRTYSIIVLACLALLACGDDSSSDDNGETDDGSADGSSVAGTPECDAWCANIEALNCPGGSCDQDFFCRVEEEDGECAASVRAYLQCEVEEGTFMCTENGWTGSSGCTPDNSLCTQ